MRRMLEYVRRLRREAGQATVEFALILPVLLFVSVGIFDIGKAFNYWIDETHLANVAARWAAVNRLPEPCTAGTSPNCTAGGDPNCANPQTIQCQVKQEADTAQLRNGATVTFCFPAGHNPPTVNAEPVQAKVTYTYQWLRFLTVPFSHGTNFFRNLGNVNITTTATMMVENTFNNDPTKDAYTTTATC